MSQRDEQLSALLDNAMDEKELQEFMQDLKRNPLEDAERVQRYQMVGDVVRDELNESSFMDISAAVHRAIEQEPSLDVKPAKQPGRIFDLSAWMKPLTGMAVAASVAMVTVVTVRLVDTDPANESQQALANVNQAPVTKNVTVAPVNPVIAQQIRAVSTEASQQNQLRRKQLNEYMMNHSGYAGQSTMQGMMPYVRVVTFDSKDSKR